MALITLQEALNERGEKKKIVVTGCLAQRYSQELADEIPEADLFFGFEHYAKGIDSCEVNVS